MMSKSLKLHTKINMKHRLKLNWFTCGRLNVGLLTNKELIFQYNILTMYTITDSWKFLNRNEK